MERRFDFNIVVEPCGILLFLFSALPSSYHGEVYCGQGASSTPPNIRIKVVTIC